MFRCFSMVSLFVVVALLYPVDSQAALSAGVCSKLAQGKAYTEAATCFLRLSHSIKAASASKVEQKLKGLYLLNASKLFQKEADAKKQPHLQAYLRERAVGVLKEYLAKKLCSQTYKCNEVQGKLWKLEKQIGYGQLTFVVASGVSGKLSLQGYQFAKQLTFPPNQNVKVRPGAYKIVVQFKGGTSKVYDVKLAPSGSKVLNLAPPKALVRRVVKRVVKRRVVSRPKPAPKAKGPPVWTWAVIGVGGAVMAAGGGLILGGMSMAISSRERADSFRSLAPGDEPDFAVLKTEYDLILNDYDTGSALNTAGWAMLGVGTAVVVVGVIAAVMVTSKSKPGADDDVAVGARSRSQRMAKNVVMLRTQ